MGQISRTVQCHSCLKHLRAGLIFCSCGTCLRADEEQKTNNHIQIPGYDCSLLSCKEVKDTARFNGKETMGKQWMEEEKEGSRHHRNQMARGWKVSNFSAGPRMDRRILSILGLPHCDRHLPHRTVAPEAPEAPVREHHHIGVQ